MAVLPVEPGANPANGDGAHERWRIEVAARDRPGLLATVAGVVADAGLDILDAAVATWGDGAAFDTLLVERASTRDRGRSAAEVAELPPPDPVKLEAGDRQRLRRPAGIGAQPRRRAALRRPRVALVHDLRGAQPRPARAAARPHRGDGERGARVHAARLVTISGTAVDRFELTDANEGKLDEETKGAVLRAVREGVAPKRRLLSRRR